MEAREAEVVLVVSPRYANDVAMGVKAAGMLPRVERLASEAVVRCVGDKIRVAVVDARGALAQGLDIARVLGAEMRRHDGKMLVLLSRSNGAEAGMAMAVGATSVLVSPFNSDAFGNALRLTASAGDGAGTVLRALTTDGLRSRDTLTGLANGDHLQQWLATQQAAGKIAIVLMLGVGRIGAINAAYGRSVADEALRAVAIRLAGVINDCLAGTAVQSLLVRLAAAEFTIGLTDDGAPIIVDALARQIVAAFAMPFLVGGREIHLNVRIGLASAAMAGDDSAEALIRQGSAALASARDGEPGAISTFSAEHNGDALLRMADLVGDLHRAINTKEITLLFQPILELATGRIAGVEALVRWDHLVFGQLDAETLLEAAATAELAVKLGRHIRARAMQEVLSWPATLAHLRLALNVTAADLADPGFVDDVHAALAATGLPNDRLTLEITEGALIDNLAGAAAVLDSLRRAGVRIVLDDFGTGFSSLAWLARLPIDGIKLDRSFTKALGGDERERIVVETVVGLARRLGLSVVAEGIEQPVELATALAAGCHAVQGFEIAMPLASPSLIDFCESWVVIPGGKSP